jgi:hypothetical protein
VTNNDTNAKILGGNMEAKFNDGNAGRDRAFFLAMAIAAGLTVFFGFAPSYT